MYLRTITSIFLLTLVGACSKTPSAEEPAAEQLAAPEPAQEAVTPDPGTAATANLPQAEAFIDAFYSFEPAQLNPLLAAAGESAGALLYYQGWAEGGNYKIVNRGACVATDEQVVSCPITVEDDPVLALKTNFNVTDTFTLTFDNGQIINVETSSNDQPIYYQAREWVQKTMPEVMTGPCKGYFAGGPTPGDCARAMTEGYRRFAASDDYPL